MKTLLLVCAAVFLGVSQGAYGQYNQEQANSDNSPSGKIHYELRGGGEPKEIWLQPVGRKNAEAAKLCETEGWGNMAVWFSPDDYWIIVQDGGASLGLHLTLFRRVKGVVYEKMKGQELGEKAMDFAAKTAGWLADYRIDHLYAKVVGWSADSRSVLISIDGGGSGGGRYYSAADYKVIYDLGGGKFNFDLSKFNAGALESGSVKDLPQK